MGCVCVELSSSLAASNELVRKLQHENKRTSPTYLLTYLLTYLSMTLACVLSCTHVDFGRLIQLAVLLHPQFSQLGQLSNSAKSEGIEYLQSWPHRN